jgi:hypothetical protein
MWIFWQQLINQQLHEFGSLMYEDAVQTKGLSWFS